MTRAALALALLVALPALAEPRTAPYDIGATLNCTIEEDGQEICRIYVTLRHVPTMIQRFDVNGDGCIGAPEWLEFVKVYNTCEEKGDVDW